MLVSLDIPGEQGVKSSSRSIRLRTSLAGPEHEVEVVEEESSISRVAPILGVYPLFSSSSCSFFSFSFSLPATLRSIHVNPRGGAARIAFFSLHHLGTPRVNPSACNCAIPGISCLNLQPVASHLHSPVAIQCVQKTFWGLGGGEGDADADVDVDGGEEVCRGAEVCLRDSEHVASSLLSLILLTFTHPASLRTR
ncbi:hypothetical protein ACJBU6_02872 [Exserohilum turcicum]